MRQFNILPQTEVYLRVGSDLSDMRLQTQVFDQTCYVTQSQCSNTGPTNPSTDHITPGVWQGCVVYTFLIYRCDLTVVEPQPTALAVTPQRWNMWFVSC